MIRLLCCDEGVAGVMEHHSEGVMVRVCECERQKKHSVIKCYTFVVMLQALFTE